MASNIAGQLNSDCHLLAKPIKATDVNNLTDSHTKNPKTDLTGSPLSHGLVMPLANNMAGNTTIPTPQAADMAID